MSFRKVAVALAFMILASTASVSYAQNGYPPGWSYGWGMGGAYGGYRNNVPTPPYFALHPPVYYGKKYERPYGDSPFAAWSQLQSNPSYAPVERPNRTQSVFNPHYRSSHVMMIEESVPAPVTQENPFYKK